MARAFYSHEMSDQDLEWLVTEFLTERPDFLPIETGSSCLMLVPYCEPMTLKAEYDEIVEVPVAKASSSQRISEMKHDA